MAGNVSPEYPSSSDKKGAGELKITNALKTVVSALNAILTSENKVDQTVFSEIANTQLKDSKIKLYTPTVIKTEETRENTSFGYLTTEDKVSSVAMNASTIALVFYEAVWKSSVSAEGEARLVVNDTNTLALDSSANSITEATEGTSFRNLLTEPTNGLKTGGVEGSELTNYFMTSGTGAGGGPVIYYAGTKVTYSFGVQFKATSGSVTAKRRKLVVVTIGT